MSESKMTFNELNLDHAYGDNFLGTEFKANIRNIRVGCTMSRPHHCPVCGAAPTTKCFDRNVLHLAYCLAPADESVPPEEQVICGERFAVTSPVGCAKHPYKNGYNLIFKEGLRGKELSLESKGITSNPEENGEIMDDVPEEKGFEQYEAKQLEAQRRRADNKKSRTRTKAKTRPIPPAMSAKKMFSKK